MSVDITQEIEREKALIAANEKLDRLATTDALTGLSNRRAFDDRMAIEVSVARRKNRPFSLLMLDIDHFKARNDAFGHSSGDDALRMIGRVLRSFVRMGDMVARIGGEEFGYLLTDCDADSARIVGERICEQIRNTPCGEASITVSVGVATLDDTMPDWKYLVACADKALYAAKREGRDRVHVYPPGSPHDFDPLSPDPHGAWISCQPEADLTSAA
jgi:diguanylate cyclase (GGDEF)-like protein